MRNDYTNDESARILPLSEMRDFEVAKGYPDIRGWRVESIDGVQVGKVHELLVDADSMRTRYLDVRLTSELAAAPHDRDVLVPIGSARLDDKADRVILPLHAERVGLLPPFERGALTRAHEYEVRRHFSLGEAAAATVAGAGAAAAHAAANVADAARDTARGTAASRGFYDHDGYDDRRFFSTRRTVPPVVETPVAPPPPQVAQPVRPMERETHIPVRPDETVVLKRGDEGRDEIIIRRPVQGGDEVR